jgi:SP family sugar porter-like MFS transporter
MITAFNSATKQDMPSIRYNLLYVFSISLTAALGGLMFGYDWVVIGGAEPFYEKYFHLISTTQVGWAMSSALVGALFGAMSGGTLSDKWGRKPLLLLSGLLFIITSVGTATASGFISFVAFRLAGGVAIGIASNLSALYIAEVAPTAIRGRLVSMNQLTIALGIMIAQIVNWLIVRPTRPGMTMSQLPLASWNVQFAWRWMFGITAMPALIFFVCLFFVPESPRWLASMGRHDEAFRVMQRIGGTAYTKLTMQEIHATLGFRDQGRLEIIRELLKPKMLRILFLGVFVAFLQQWCGINIIFQYGSRIFTQAGYGVSDVMFNIAITGMAAVLMTFVAIRTVDNWGRRGLMLSGSLSLSLIYAATGWVYQNEMKGVIPVALVVCAIACYCYSLAPVTWVILAEIFPNRIRGGAMSISVVALWLSNFLLSQSFPAMFRTFGLAHCFWIYGAICLGGFLFMYWRLPETKGKSLEQIESELVD